MRRAPRSARCLRSIRYQVNSGQEIYVGGEILADKTVGLHGGRRIVEITTGGIIDRMMGYDKYLENSDGEGMKDHLAAACWVRHR